MNYEGEVWGTASWTHTASARGRSVARRKKLGASSGDGLKLASGSLRLQGTDWRDKDSSWRKRTV